MTDHDSSKSKLARQLGFLALIPFMLGVAPMVGWFMGDWLDRRLGTGPVLMLIFLGLGFVAGIRETITLVRRASLDGE